MLGMPVCTSSTQAPHSTTGVTAQVSAHSKQQLIALRLTGGHSKKEVCLYRTAARKNGKETTAPFGIDSM